MEVNKALKVINNVTSNINGTRQDHQIILQAIQAIVNKIQEPKAEIKNDTSVAKEKK